MTSLGSTNKRPLRETLTPLRGTRVVQPELRMVYEELGIKEEDLQPKPFEEFHDPDLPEDIQKLLYKRYEIKRKEKVNLVNKKMKERKQKLKIMTMSKILTSENKAKQHKGLNGVYDVSTSFQKQSHGTGPFKPHQQGKTVWKIA